MLLIPNFRFTNWAGNIVTTAKVYAQPETEEQLISLIATHNNIKVVGTGHSWTDQFSTDELLINLDRYNRVLDINRTEKTITVQAGIKLWELNDVLDKVGLAFTNLGSIDRQSLAGAISTGTHGTGINFSCLASQVLYFTLITATGEKHTYHKGEDNFNTAIINLGVLGIVSEICLQVTEAYNLHDYTYTLPFTEVIERIDEFIYGNDHFKLWWLPPAQKVVVYTYKRTQEPVNDTRLRQFLKDEVISVVGYRLLVQLGNVNPAWRKPINTFLTGNFDKPLNRIEKSYKVFRVPEPPKHRETEWAFDIKNVQQLLKDYRQLFTNTKHTFNFIQEIRFTKRDDFWLSECYGRDTVWIGAYNHMDKQWDGIMQEFEAFALAHGGRPHWGKEHTLKKEKLRALYPKFDDFVAFKNTLDPNRKFTNHFTADILGD